MKARKPGHRLETSAIDGYTSMAKLNRRELIAMPAGFTASLTVSGCFNGKDMTAVDVSSSDRLGRLLPLRNLID